MSRASAPRLRRGGPVGAGLPSARALAHGRFVGGGKEADRKLRDVLPAFPQRGRMDSNDGQAVVEVFAKAAAAGGVQQGRVGSGDNTGIKGHVLVAAQGADAAGGERPQQGLLHLGRGIAHFIQHESAAAGGQKCALAALFGFGEGSLGMPEERIHEQAFVQCAAVDGNEWPSVPGAQAVDGGGDKLFARARFAHHQHVGRDLGGLAHLFVEGPHGRGIAHQPVGGQILRMGQIQHGFAPPLGVVFRLLAAAELFGQAQPFQQGVYARAQAFQLHGQRGSPRGAALSAALRSCRRLVTLCRLPLIWRASHHRLRPRSKNPPPKAAM